MMNNIARLGPEIAMSRSENLHTSGHAYRSAPLLHKTMQISPLPPHTPSCMIRGDCDKNIVAV